MNNERENYRVIQKERYSDRRICPCCGDSAAARWTLSSTRRAEGMDFVDLKNSWAGFFQEKSFFTYRKCPSCGIVYCQQYFTDRQLEELYEGMEDNTAGLDSTFLARAQAGYYEIIKGFLKSRGDYLELGPDIGLFTQNIIQNEHFETHWFIEPNVKSHGALASVCKDKKHKIYQSTDDIEKIPEGSLSLVVMVHVLDHLLQPLELLKKIQRKMCDGGVMAIVIHDQSSLLATLLKQKWPAYCLQHPQVFSPKTIANLLARAGLKNTQVFKTYNYFPFNYLVKHLLYACSLKRCNVDFLPRRFVRIKLGNMAAISVKTTG
jgi:hypothetical protein